MSKDIDSYQWFKDLSFSKWSDPYEINPGKGKRKNGKISKELIKYKGSRGVYMIKDEKGKILYVGATYYSLYASVGRRFQVWNDDKPNGEKRFNRATYSPKGLKFRVMVMPDSFKEARILKVETFYIKKLDPRDNIEDIDYGPMSIKKGETVEQFYNRREREERKAEQEYLKYGGFGGDLNDYLNEAKSWINEILPF
jgi:excinuclease UvrABC nuclease subunit